MGPLDLLLDRLVSSGHRKNLIQSVLASQRKREEKGP